MESSFIIRIVEAALLASQQPLTLAQLHGLFTLDEPAPDGSIEHALDTLRESCTTRGIELVETASGYRFQVQADVHAWVARLWTERQTKYTRATLETLAIIAYRQPITRGEIEQIRGVAVSSNIIKALEEREWIRSVGHRDVPGRPELLGTTRTFLDYFGLRRLEDLPPLSELKDFAELDPQLTFADPDAPKAPAGQAIAAGVAMAADTADGMEPGADADAGTAADDAQAETEAEADAVNGAAAAATTSDTPPDEGGEHVPDDAGIPADTDDTDDTPERHAADDEHDRHPADATDSDDAPFHPARDAADAAHPDDNALVDEDDSTGARHEP